MNVTATANGVRPPFSSDPAGIREVLSQLELPCYVVEVDGRIGVGNETPDRAARVLAAVAPLPPERLGSSLFRDAHGLGYAYVGGAMAGGIASEKLVVELARAGCLGSFGAGGVGSERLERAVRELAATIPGLPFAVNLLHSPNEPALERDVVALCLAHRVRLVEASAFLDLTPALVHYRLAGLRRGSDGEVEALNRIIAKVSRPETARRFLLPAPQALVDSLLAGGTISEEQAQLARSVPMADALTVEADSGGHTDRRPLLAMFPVIARLRHELAVGLPGRPPVQLGAAGGIGTPQAVASAFALGAEYVLTGSVNQMCVEAGTSQRAREMLAKAGVADFDMAPSSDMFELGAQVQVLKSGTMFASRARRLHQLYLTYAGLDAVSGEDRAWLEGKVLRQPVADVWTQVVEHFERRDPEQIRRATADPKRQMALVFRWYLGLSSRWASSGDPERSLDYQIWSGPATGAFNDWVRGSYLAAPENRTVADVARHLLRGGAFLTRTNQLSALGVRLPSSCTDYGPGPGPCSGSGRQAGDEAMAVAVRP